MWSNPQPNSPVLSRTWLQHLVTLGWLLVDPAWFCLLDLMLYLLFIFCSLWFEIRAEAMSLPSSAAKGILVWSQPFPDAEIIRRAFSTACPAPVLPPVQQRLHKAVLFPSSLGFQRKIRVIKPAILIQCSQYLILCWSWEVAGSALLKVIEDFT